MKRAFDLIVFDWDGTLVDSTAHIAVSLQRSCVDLGIAAPSDSSARYVIGLGFEDAIRHVAPDLPASRYPELVNRYRVHYVSGEETVVMFPGVTRGLRELRAGGHLIAIATGKSRRGLDRALALTSLDQYTDASRCADEGFAKPHPGMLLWLMQELAVAPARTLMVGDTTHDLQMARSAGVSAVAATYGAHSRDMLEEHEPVACLASFKEFLQWMRSAA